MTRFFDSRAWFRETRSCDRIIFAAVISFDYPLDLALVSFLGVVLRLPRNGVSRRTRGSRDGGGVRTFARFSGTARASSSLSTSEVSNLAALRRRFRELCDKTRRNADSRERVDTLLFSSSHAPSRNPGSTLDTRKFEAAKSRIY